MLTSKVKTRAEITTYEEKAAAIKKNEKRLKTKSSIAK